LIAQDVTDDDVESVKKFVEDKLKLIVNERKSQVVALKETTFLGFHITSMAPLRHCMYSVDQ
jgi:hypothetical protein